MLTSRRNGNYAAAVNLYCEGHTRKAIAEKLGVKPSTVKEYLDRARVAFRAESRAELFAAVRAYKPPVIVTPPALVGPKKPMGVTPHGTVTAYTNKGCRCLACRDAWADYNREYRAARIAAGVPDDVHGTTNGYTNYRCRCDDCVAAAREKRRRSR